MLSSKVFKICQNNDVIYLQIPMFNETNLVKHGFSTRHGGKSDGIYKSMNLGFNRGDAEENVRENYRILCETLRIDTEDLVLSDQIHEDKILVINQKDRGKGYNKDSDIIGVDGLITNEKDVALVTSYADCVPLFFLDPVEKVIALSHSGWRGTVKKIGGKTIRMMSEHFGSKPENILAAIGPSIGACCYEVSEDVKIEVEKMFNHDIIDKIVKKQGKNKYMIDLWEANSAVLLEAGILKEHLQKTDICTMCHKDDLFSHRGSEGKRGNMVAIMALK